MQVLVGNMLIKVNHPLLLPKDDRENEECPANPVYVEWKREKRKRIATILAITK